MVFQKFHTRDEAVKLIEDNGFKVEEIAYGKYGETFQIVAKKVENIPVSEQIAAINFEFDLPLPNNKTYGRSAEVLEVLGLNEN